MAQVVLKRNCYHCPKCLGEESPYTNQFFSAGSWTGRPGRAGLGTTTAVRVYIPDSYFREEKAG